MFLSTIVLLLSSSAKNYLNNWSTKFIDTSTFDNSVVTVSYSIGMASLGGILCQVYHCLITMDKLSAIVMLLWSLLFVINNFQIFINFKPKVISSKLIWKMCIIFIILKCYILASCFCIYCTSIFNIYTEKFN